MSLTNRLVWGGAIVTLTLGLTAVHAQQPEEATIAHAKRVLSLLEQGKMDDVAMEFNSQVSAAMTGPQLRDVWAAVHQQIGLFKSFLDTRIQMPLPGVTAVVLGCQFEKAAMNIVVSFDQDDLIAGLRILQRPGAAQPAQAPPASSRFTEESVIVGSEWALPGTLSTPVGEVAASVVLVHGSGPGDRDETVGANKPFRDLAWGLANRGIAVLRYEKRTRQHAGRIPAISPFTVKDETIDDALLAVQLLRMHARIDPRRVFVLGHSLGGTLAPRIGAGDSSIAGLVIMAGATRPLLEVAREQLVYLASLGGGAGTPNVDAALQQLRQSAPESYWRDLDAYKPAQAAAKLSVPMLILQGERDYQVTLDDFHQWRDALKGRRDVTLKSYPTLNHLFQPGEGKSTPAEYQREDHIPDVVLDDVAAWLKHI